MKMSGECPKCHEHCLDCKCSVKPSCNDYTIKIEGYTTSNPRLKENEIWINVARQWISVKDRLPTGFTPVLTSDGEFVYCAEIMYWLDEEHKIPAFCDQRNGLSLQEITHWMPLPEPPKT